MKQEIRPGSYAGFAISMVDQDIKNQYNGYLLETQSRKQNTCNRLTKEITAIFNSSQTVFMLYDWPKVSQKTLASIIRDEPDERRVTIKLTDHSKARISRFAFCQRTNLILNQNGQFIKNDKLIRFYQSLPTYKPNPPLSDSPELFQPPQIKTIPIRQDFEW